MKSIPTRTDFEQLLDAVPDPLLALTAAGKVHHANAAARALFGREIVGEVLSERLAAEPAADLVSFLRRCTGSTAPSVGAFTFRTLDGESHKCRAYGSRLQAANGAEEVGVALRLQDTRDDQFSVLARIITRLNEQIRLRLRYQAELEASTHEQELLLRELQHRVKNNIQMLLSMFGAASRDAQGSELKSFIVKARGRLMAMSIVHDAMHRSHTLQSSRTDGLLDRLTHSIIEALCPTADVTIEIEGHTITNDKSLPLALILNELVTNACKYGVRNGSGVIGVHFRRTNGLYELIVRDDGPGLPRMPAGSRQSGLGLVQALARQLKGEMSLDNLNGACCTIRFPAGGPITE